METTVTVLGQAVPALFFGYGIDRYYSAKLGAWILDRIEELPESGPQHEGYPVKCIVTDRHGDEHVAYPGPDFLKMLRRARELQQEKDAAVARTGQPIQYCFGQRCFLFGPEIFTAAAFERLPDESFSIDGLGTIRYVFPFPSEGYAAKQQWIAQTETAIAYAEQQIHHWCEAQVAAGKLIKLSFAWGKHPQTKRSQLEAPINGAKYVVDDRATRIIADAGVAYYCRLGRVLVDKPNFRLVLVTPTIEAAG